MIGLSFPSTHDSSGKGNLLPKRFPWREREDGLDPVTSSTSCIIHALRHDTHAKSVSTNCALYSALNRSSSRVNYHRAHGKSRPKSAPAFRPKFCDLDKKVLRFFAHFEEAIDPAHASAAEGGGGDASFVRRRHVHVLYHLEDDTVSVIEPRVPVSSYCQRASV